MRAAWFGDNRDIVKWSALLHIAKQHEASTIVQVCYLNPHEFSTITVDDTDLPVPAEVIRHFREISSVKTLSPQIPVAVFAEQFDERSSYRARALNFIAQSQGRRRVVFLDPDTGLAPRSADVKHVTNEDVAAYWSALSAGEVLALYQHQTNRNNTPWIEPKRKQFAEAMKMPLPSVKIAKAEKIARDVVFFYASKV